MSTIAGFEKRTRRTLSPGARELFRNDFPTCVIAGDAESGFGRLDFQPLAKIEARPVAVLDAFEVSLVRPPSD